MTGEPICYCGHDAALHPRRMEGRRFQPRGNCYASSGCKCTKYEAIELAATNIIAGPTPAEFYQPQSIKPEDLAPYRPSLVRQMEDRHMHAYLKRQHEDLETLCGKEIADVMYGSIDTDKCHISGCTCGKPKYDRQTEDQMKRPMQQEFVDMAFWDKKEPKITTQTVITISSGNGFSTSELREFLDVAEGNHVPTPDLPVEAIFRPAQNDEPATFILRVTKTLNAEGADDA